jgi:hypothetical protein
LPGGTEMLRYAIAGFDTQPIVFNSTSSSSS